MVKYIPQIEEAPVYPVKLPPPKTTLQAVNYPAKGTPVTATKGSTVIHGTVGEGFRLYPSLAAYIHINIEGDDIDDISLDTNKWNIELDVPSTFPVGTDALDGGEL